MVVTVVRWLIDSRVRLIDRRGGDLNLLLTAANVSHHSPADAFRQPGLQKTGATGDG